MFCPFITGREYHINQILQIEIVTLRYLLHCLSRHNYDTKHDLDISWCRLLLSLKKKNQQTHDGINEQPAMTGICEDQIFELFTALRQHRGGGNNSMHTFKRQHVPAKNSSTCTFSIPEPSIGTSLGPEPKWRRLVQKDADRQK